MTTTYGVDKAHAMPRLKQRFNVNEAQAKVWANEKLTQSVRLYTQDDGRAIYHHLFEDINFVVDEKTKVIITVIDKSAMKAHITSSYLDEIVDVMMTKAAKIRKEHARKERDYERTYAIMMGKAADSRLKLANSYNPISRATIEREIRRYDEAMENTELYKKAEKDEYFKAMIKIQSFLLTTNEKKL